MDYSNAILKMKEGHQIYRLGWNGIAAGKTMYVYMVIDAIIRYPVSKTGNYSDFIQSIPYTLVKLEPTMMLYDNSKELQSTWHASMIDTVSDDWVSVQEQQEKTEKGKKMYAEAIELIDKHQIPTPSLREKLIKLTEDKDHKCFPKTTEHGALSSEYSIPNNLYPCIGCDTPMSYRVAHLLIMEKEDKLRSDKK